MWRDLPFDEIAAATGKTATAVRQIAHRARSHVAARRPRVEVDHRVQRDAIARFLAALQTGDLDAGLISRIFPVRNPDKLHRLAEETALSR